MPPPGAHRETTPEDIAKVLDPETFNIVIAINDEITPWLKCRSPASVAPGAAKIMTTIRMDEPSIVQLPHPEGDVDALHEYSSPARILCQMTHFPHDPFTLPWASALEGSCRSYVYHDDGTNLLSCRP